MEGRKLFLKQQFFNRKNFSLFSFWRGGVLRKLSRWITGENLLKVSWYVLSSTWWRNQWHLFKRHQKYGVVQCLHPLMFDWMRSLHVATSWIKIGSVMGLNMIHPITLKYFEEDCLISWPLFVTCARSPRRKTLQNQGLAACFASVCASNLGLWTGDGTKPDVCLSLTTRCWKDLVYKQHHDNPWCPYTSTTRHMHIFTSGRLQVIHRYILTGYLVLPR